MYDFEKMNIKEIDQAIYEINGIIMEYMRDKSPEGKIALQGAISNYREAVQFRKLLED